MYKQLGRQAKDSRKNIQSNCYEKIYSDDGSSSSDRSKRENYEKKKRKNKKK